MQAPRSPRSSSARSPPSSPESKMVAAVRDDVDRMAIMSAPNSKTASGSSSSSGNSSVSSSAPSSKAGGSSAGVPPVSDEGYVGAVPGDDLPEQAATLKRYNPDGPGAALDRKQDDIEYRRRSATLRADSSVSSSDSRGVNSFDRVKESGVNRLLRADSSLSSISHDDGVHSNPSILPSSNSAIVNLLLAHQGDIERQPSIGSGGLHWSHVVLKMTSFSDDDLVTSFRFGEQGGTIGREKGNTAAIPADKLLASSDHARVEYRSGRFYIVNSSSTNSGTFIRLTGTGSNAKVEDRMQWPLVQDTVFRAGKSDFYVTQVDAATQTLEISAKSGKLNGKTFTIGPEGAGIGRSAENLIHAGDGELSRKHCRVWYDESTSCFYLIDLNSTNGTFMKLSGPYSDPYRLEIGDDLLVSQTCLTVNRFDYGAFANMGQRKNMEDAHTIIQDLNVASLARLGLYPQSFFGVYDGHGGMEASAYLGDTLHHNIIEEFHSKQEAWAIEDKEAGRPPEEDEVYDRIALTLEDAFQRTDADFLSTSDRPQAGSTATTALIAGNQLFVANVGDSRTVLSRNGQAVRLSNDHKPNRPDEAARIRDTGGFVIHGRVMGELAVSRAFGDSPFKEFELPDPLKKANDSKPRSEYDSQELPVNPNDILKGPLVIALPEITRTELTGDEEFILLASDGLYDVLKDQEAINFVRKKIVELGDVQRAVEATVEHAIVQQRSMDNVTAVVIMFKEPKDIAAAMANASLPQPPSNASTAVPTPPVTLRSFAAPPPSTGTLSS